MNANTVVLVNYSPWCENCNNVTEVVHSLFFFPCLVVTEMCLIFFKAVAVMIVFYETSFLFLFSKPKFWAYSKWTVSLWHSWDLWACMEGKYIPLLDLSQEDPRGIYSTSEFPSAFHDCNSCVLFCIHNWLICIFKGLIHFLFLIWRHMISFSLYSQGLWLLFSISLPCHLWEQIREKITLSDYWDKERIIQAAKEKKRIKCKFKDSLKHEQGN